MLVMAAQLQQTIKNNEKKNSPVAFFRVYNRIPAAQLLRVVWISYVQYKPNYIPVVLDDHSTDIGLTDVCFPQNRTQGNGHFL
jgi:hypothetical protein